MSCQTRSHYRLLMVLDLLTVSEPKGVICMKPLSKSDMYRNERTGFDSKPEQIDLKTSFSLY